MGSLLLFFGCPDPTPSGGTTSNEVVDLVYGDVTYASGSSTLSLAVDAFGKNNGDAGCLSTDGANITDVEQSSGGANGSTNFRSTALTLEESCWAVAFLTLESDYNATGKMLKVNIKSPATGGVSAIKMKLEGADMADATNEVEKTFTNDGTWQEVAWLVSDFAFSGALSATNIRKVTLVLADANGAGAGIGAQTLDYDEIRFD